MAAGLRMKIVEEFIAAGIERSDKDYYFLPRTDDLLTMKLIAFKFGCGLVLVADDELDFGAGRNLHFARHELVILQRDRETRNIRQRGCRQQQTQQPGDRQNTTHRQPQPLRMRTARNIAAILLRGNGENYRGSATVPCVWRIARPPRPGSSRSRTSANTASNIAGVSFPVLVLSREQ